MIGVIKKAHKNNIQDVKGQAKMDKPVTAQQLGMDLLLVVIQPNQMGMVYRNGVNNYFHIQLSSEAMQPSAISSQKII